MITVLLTHGVYSTSSNGCMHSVTILSLHSAVLESSNVNCHCGISCLLLNNKPYIPLTVNNNTCISTCTTCIRCSTLHYIVFILHT